MKRLHFRGWRSTALLVLGAMLVGGRPALGDQITGIVAFGDSLSDVGNFYATTGGASPPAPFGYDAGRFSNGPNWVEYLARDLGVAAPTSSINGGTDYAYGGALTGSGTNPYASFVTLTGAVTATVPNIGQQVSTYLASNTPTAGQLFTIWGGANDVLNSPPGVTPNPVASADNIAQAISALAHAGATQFIVPNLPPLNLLPVVTQANSPVPAAEVPLLAQFTLVFNQELQADIASLQGKSGVQIHLLDMYSLVNDVMANPSKYGFTDVHNSALLSGSNGQGFLFWDTIHPTTEADAIIGGIAAQSVPEPSSVVLFGAGIVVIAGSAGWRRWARRHSTR
jgi:phospholipase/lecithinase/hemolysin